MGSLKEEADAYEAKSQKNISDLDKVSIDNNVNTETRQDGQGKDYTVKFIIINDEEYRVPDSVIAQLKELRKANPKLKNFKVKRTGTGMNTKYQTIPLE